MIRFRGHHLICLHFFRGEGYNPEFIINLHELIKKVEYGEIIEVSEGADDVCAKCPYLKGNKCFHNRNSEDEIRQMDSKALELLNTEPGAKLNWLKIKETLPDIFKDWFKFYCTICTWESTCDKNPLWLKLNTERLDNKVSRRESMHDKKAG